MGFGDQFGGAKGSFVSRFGGVGRVVGGGSEGVPMPASAFLGPTSNPTHSMPYAVIFAGEVTGTTGTDSVIHGSAGANDSNLGTNVFVNITASGGTSHATSTPWPAARCVVMIEFDGATSNIWLDGVLIAENVNLGSETMAGIFLGSAGAGGLHSTVAMHGVYYDDGELTAEKRGAWETYVAEKWGLLS